MRVSGTHSSGRRGLLVEEDAALDGLAADGTLAHAVATQLAGAVSAHEDHVLQPVQAHGAHGLHGNHTTQAVSQLWLSLF